MSLQFKLFAATLLCFILIVLAYLFGGGAFFILLALLLIGFFGVIHWLVYPLQGLAKIREAIKAGKLKEFHFPEMGKRGDEIADLTSALQSLTGEFQEKEKIRSLLNRVVSKDIAEEILKSELHLGGEDRVVMILFADIRNFTEMTAHFPPQKTVRMLNATMTKMSRIIEGEGGVIDKYVGDAIMALFGAPISHPDHAIRSLSCAKLMIETLRNWNIERVKEGEVPVEMGIGIHTGMVVAGNMGAEDRLNYTVLGASVNLASRLCHVAKGQQIIISEYTLEEPQVKDLFYVEPLEAVTLKGFSQPVKIYEVTGFKWESK